MKKSICSLLMCATLVNIWGVTTVFADAISVLSVFENPENFSEEEKYELAVKLMMHDEGTAEDVAVGEAKGMDEEKARWMAMHMFRDDLKIDEKVYEFCGWEPFDNAHVLRAIAVLYAFGVLIPYVDDDEDAEWYAEMAREPDGEKKILEDRIKDMEFYANGQPEPLRMEIQRMRELVVEI